MLGWAAMADSSLVQSCMLPKREKPSRSGRTWACRLAFRKRAIIHPDRLVPPTSCPRKRDRSCQPIMSLSRVGGCSSCRTSFSAQRLLPARVGIGPMGRTSADWSGNRRSCRHSTCLEPTFQPRDLESSRRRKYSRDLPGGCNPHQSCRAA